MSWLEQRVYKIKATVDRELELENMISDLSLLNFEMFIEQWKDKWPLTMMEDLSLEQKKKVCSTLVQVHNQASNVNQSVREAIKRKIEGND